MLLQIMYNVGMKDSEIRIRTDKEFLDKVDYLQRINGYKSKSDTIRKTVEKEYRKEYSFEPNVMYKDGEVATLNGKAIIFGTKERKK